MKKSISYETIADICTRLKKDGSTSISVRDVQSKSGGSFTTVGEHLRRWKAENQLASSGVDLSDSFKHAVMAEIGRVVKESSVELKQQLEDIRIQLTESNSLLAEAEESAEVLKIRLKDSETSASKRIAELETELAIVRDRLAESTKRFGDQIETLQKTLKDSQESKHAAELDSARTTARLEEILKREQSVK